MSHTPTPWRTGSKHPGRIITNDRVIAFVTHPDDEGTESPEDIATAAFIVRCCNSHNELVAALEDAEFLLRKAGQIAGPMQDSFKRSAEDARAALKLAKGE